MKRSDPVFLAWCAGFFDGEGSVVITRAIDRRGKGEKERLYLAALTYQTQREPLDEIRDAFGGSVCKLKTRVYSLHMTARVAAEFLAAIQPYCRVKGPEIDIALEFSSTFGQRKAFRLDPETERRRQSLRGQLIQFRKDKYAATRGAA